MPSPAWKTLATMDPVLVRELRRLGLEHLGQLGARDHAVLDEVVRC